MRPCLPRRGRFASFAVSRRAPSTASPAPSTCTTRSPRRALDCRTPIGSAWRCCGPRWRPSTARQADSQPETGLNPIEPLGRAFVRSVLEHPADGGLFGPDSMVWRVHRDRSFPLAGIRSLMVQALHPLAMAGVAEHSSWQQDPFGRLAATSGYILTVTYGDNASAHHAASRVRGIHGHVNGTDQITGLAYRASDPSLLLLIHAAIVDSIVHVVQRYGRGLDATSADRYVAEMVRFAELVGVPTEM